MFISSGDSAEKVLLVVKDQNPGKNTHKSADNARGEGTKGSRAPVGIVYLTSDVGDQTEDCRYISGTVLVVRLAIRHSVLAVFCPRPIVYSST